ncbi:DUF4112 domain-containing protein [Nitrospira sp. Nam74]
MEQVRSKEQQAELIAHLLDDAIRLPGTSIRFGADPIVGLMPVVGDVLAVLSGALILLIARQLHVPTNDLIRMAYHQPSMASSEPYRSWAMSIHSASKATPKTPPCSYA